jgi:hypothetical protein
MTITLRFWLRTAERNEYVQQKLTLSLGPLNACFRFISYKISNVTVETSLNLAWAVLAAAMFLFWLRYRPRHKASSSLQVAALTVCVLILLPVISISDDLLAAQFPAETDTSLRWGHRPSDYHPDSHHIPVLLHTPFDFLNSRPVAGLANEASRLTFVLPQVSIRLRNRPPPGA